MLKIKRPVIDWRLGNNILTSCAVVGLATVPSSLAAIGLYKLFIGDVAGWDKYLEIFLPMFTATIVLATVYSNIRESRVLATRQRNQSVRPILFFSFQQQQRIVDGKYSGIEFSRINSSATDVLRVADVENNGLGAALNVMLLQAAEPDPKSLEGQLTQMDGILSRVLPNVADQSVKIKTNFAEGGTTLFYSHYFDSYGNTHVCAHYVERNRRTKRINTLNLYIEHFDPLYKQVIAERDRLHDKLLTLEN